jgi:hypothetical protein
MSAVEVSAGGGSICSLGAERPVGEGFLVLGGTLGTRSDPVEMRCNAGAFGCAGGVGSGPALPGRKTRGHHLGGRQRFMGRSSTTRDRHPRCAAQPVDESVDEVGDFACREPERTRAHVVPPQGQDHQIRFVVPGQAHGPSTAARVEKHLSGLTRELRHGVMMPRRTYGSKPKARDLGRGAH